jgi:hypothetical protein
MTTVGEVAIRLGEISARLREMADGGMARRLSQGIGRAVEPLEAEVRDGLRAHMPDRYANLINAELKVTRRTFTGPDGARVTVFAQTTGDGKRRIGRLDDGILWHPLFGRFPRRDPRNQWFMMTEPHVRPGWWSDATDQAAPRVRQEIADALNDVTERLARG